MITTVAQWFTNIATRAKKASYEQARLVTTQIASIYPIGRKTHPPTAIYPAAWLRLRPQKHDSLGACWLSDIMHVARLGQVSITPGWSPRFEQP